MVKTEEKKKKKVDKLQRVILKERSCPLLIDTISHMSTFVQSSNSELAKTKIIVATCNHIKIFGMGRELTLQPRTPAKSSPAQTNSLKPRLF